MCHHYFFVFHTCLDLHLGPDSEVTKNVAQFLGQWRHIGLLFIRYMEKVILPTYLLSLYVYVVL